MGEAKSPDRVANDAALLEYYFKSIDDECGFKSLDDESGRCSLIIGQKYPELYGWEIVDAFTFDRPENGRCTKAFAVKDPDGNLYLHFNGTGDGNWEYNAVAYGPQNGKVTSDLQDQALNWFDEVVREKYDFDGEHKLYVTGHSQGGNNAQFVTLRSQYGDLVDTCVSLDGPNFSNESVEQTKELIGEDAYSRRTDKMHGYYGQYDYVSCLGEENVIPDNHIKFIDYDEYKGFDFKGFHMAYGLFYGEPGNLILGNFQDEPSAFREFVLACNEKIKEFPEEKREALASAMMKICENMAGGEQIKVDLSEEELDLVIDMVLPALLENCPAFLNKLQEDPATLDDIATLLNPDDKLLTEIRVQFVIHLLSGYFENIASEYASLSDEDKQKINDLIKDVVNVKNGEIDLHDLQLSNVIDAIKNNPEAVDIILRSPEISTLVDVAIEIFLIVVITIIAAFVANIGLFAVLTAAAYYLKDEIAIFVEELGEALAKFFTHLCDFVVAVCNKVTEFIKNFFARGSEYAASNPYIKVDTALMDSYAAKLRRVNQRLTQLDRDMNDLYWQVGFLDLADILAANLITCESRGISKVIDYLTETADDFNRVENKVRQMFGW